MAVTRPHVANWLAGYERAWRTAGTAPLAELFTADATYRQSPYAEQITGLAAIGEMWDAERESHDEAFTMETTIVALDSGIVVVRVEVAYGDGVPREYRDLWVIEFADDGRCAAFEEWPFFPGQPIASNPTTSRPRASP